MAICPGPKQMWTPEYKLQSWQLPSTIKHDWRDKWAVIYARTIKPEQASDSVIYARTIKPEQTYDFLSYFYTHEIQQHEQREISVSTLKTPSEQNSKGLFLPS